MYNLIIYIYQLGVIIASLFNEKVRKMWRGEREAIRILKEKVDPNAQYVWFHAASLGEFEQGRPLIEQLRQDHPEYKILLTLRTIRPVMAFFIKYEFWYNYLHILKHRGVPVYSVSSIFRPGQIFFRWYGRQYSHVLKCFTHFFVQNEISKELLGTIGITNVSIVGDTRFDRVLQIKAAAKQLPIVEAFLDVRGEGSEVRGEKSGAAESGSAEAPKVFVAGSSWPPDEDIFIPFFNEHRDWKLIIAPHVIGEEHLKQIESKLAGRKVARYSSLEDPENPEIPDNLEVLIIDCFGLLSSIYHYADVTYVGGGFGVGIHNTLEAAVWDVPVIFGPNNERFQEAQGLKACGGGYEITGADDFRRIMQRFIDTPQTITEAGRQSGAFVQQMTGATKKVLSAVDL